MYSSVGKTTMWTHDEMERKSERGMCVREFKNIQTDGSKQEVIQNDPHHWNNQIENHRLTIIFIEQFPRKMPKQSRQKKKTKLEQSAMCYDRYICQRLVQFSLVVCIAVEHFSCELHLFQMCVCVRIGFSLMSMYCEWDISVFSCETRQKVGFLENKSGLSKVLLCVRFE